MSNPWTTPNQATHVLSHDSEYLISCRATRQPETSCNALTEKVTLELCSHESRHDPLDVVLCSNPGPGQCRLQCICSLTHSMSTFDVSALVLWRCRCWRATGRATRCRCWTATPRPPTRCSPASCTSSACRSSCTGCSRWWCARRRCTCSSSSTTSRCRSCAPGTSSSCRSSVRRQLLLALHFRVIYFTFDYCPEAGTPAFWPYSLAVAQMISSLTGGSHSQSFFFN